jgi:hypothetical protein
MVSFQYIENFSGLVNKDLRSKIYWPISSKMENIRWANIGKND